MHICPICISTTCEHADPNSRYDSIKEHGIAQASALEASTPKPKYVGYRVRLGIVDRDIAERTEQKKRNFDE